MDAKGIAEGFKRINMMAVKAVGENKYEEAIAIFKEGLALEEKLGLVNQMAESYANIGNAYFSAGELDEALNYLTKAQEQFKKAGKTDGVVTVSINASTILELKEDGAGALKQLNDSLRIVRDGGKRGTLQFRIAYLHQRAGRQYQAQEAYGRALMEFERLNRSEDVLYCLMARASMFMQINQKIPAERDIARAKSMARADAKLAARLADAAAELGINMN